jgi:hypothetical protein
MSGAKSGEAVLIPPGCGRGKSRKGERGEGRGRLSRRPLTPTLSRREREIAAKRLKIFWKIVTLKRKRGSFSGTDR